MPTVGNFSRVAPSKPWITREPGGDDHERRQQAERPDLTKGVSLAEFKDGKLLGHVGDEDVLLVRARRRDLRDRAHCTHYHGPLAEGLVVGDTVRCPWHHACFSLRTGEACVPPASTRLRCWKVEQRDRT